MRTASQKLFQLTEKEVKHHSRVLFRRFMKHSPSHRYTLFTLIELLMKYTCQPCNYVLYYRRE